mgnify:CR=1 FL=1
MVNFITGNPVLFPRLCAGIPDAFAGIVHKSNGKSPKLTNKDVVNAIRKVDVDFAGNPNIDGTFIAILGFHTKNGTDVTYETIFKTIIDVAITSAQFTMDLHGTPVPKDLKQAKDIYNQCVFAATTVLSGTKTFHVVTNASSNTYTYTFSPDGTRLVSEDNLPKNTPQNQAMYLLDLTRETYDAMFRTEIKVVEKKSSVTFVM